MYIYIYIWSAYIYIYIYALQEHMLRIESVITEITALDGVAMIYEPPSRLFLYTQLRNTPCSVFNTNN